MVAVPCATAVGASQLHAPLLSLEFESLFQPKLQRFGRMGGRSTRNLSDILLHERNRFRVFEVRNQKIALHLHDLLLVGGHPRENLVYNILRRNFALDVCKGTVAEGLDLEQTRQEVDALR